MAHSKFTVEILTPEGEAFNEEVEMISTRTVMGTIGVMANHEPVMAMLEPTELRVYRSEKEIVRFAQGEGYLQVANNHAMLLVEEVVAPEDLNVEDLEAKLAEATERAATSDPGSAEQANALRDQRRAETFLSVVREQS